MQADASVAIVMGTFDGADMLPMQLESFAAQSLLPSRIVISDDGSRDATRAVISAWANAHPEIDTAVIEGPRRGAAQNFLSLLRQDLGTDFLAISDQDDVWLPEKLKVAVEALRRLPESLPALYCGRTWEVPHDLSRRKLSRGAPRPPGFSHALVQNIAGGNTMVLNRAGAQAIREAARVTSDCVVHDWWIYQVISGIGGTVIFDNTPHLLYRQHEGNVIGANRGFAATLLRAHALVSGRFSDWCDCNIAAMRQIEDRLTPANRGLLEAFVVARTLPPLQSLAAIRRAGFYRQGWRAQLSLYLAAVLGKL